MQAISQYLSFTECIPIFNLPAGIIHLICAIFEVIFPRESSDPIEIEDLSSLTRKKLDDWTHLQKALSILSIVGTILLMIKRVTRVRDYVKIMDLVEAYEFNAEEKEMPPFPDFVLQDQEWVISLLNSTIMPDMFIKAVPTPYREDKNLILEIIYRGLFRTPWYPSLEEDLKKDLEIIFPLIDQDPYILKYLSHETLTNHSFLTLFYEKLVQRVRSDRDEDKKWYRAFMCLLPQNRETSFDLATLQINSLDQQSLYATLQKLSPS